jgi:hypothetical protein
LPYQENHAFLPHIPCHIVHRGNNREACFFCDDDFGDDDFGYYIHSINRCFGII